jgi:predicted peptidase
MLKVFQQTTKSAIRSAYQYFLSIPAAYDVEKPEKHWPLLLFLHGLDESHGPIDKVLNHGPPKLIHAHSSSKKDERPMDNINMECARVLAENFIVCSPQLDRGDAWDATTLSALLDDLEQKYRIDKNKIYVTGLSMGRFLESNRLNIFVDEL